MKFHYFEVIIRASEKLMDLPAEMKEREEWKSKGYEQIARSSMMLGEGDYSHGDILQILGTMWATAKEDFLRKLASHLT